MGTTKKALEDWCRRLLALRVGTVFSTTAQYPEDRQAFYFLCALVQRHPEFTRLVGLPEQGGISHFVVSNERRKVHGRKVVNQKHFELHRKDGSYAPFGYTSCIRSKPVPSSSSSSSSISTSSANAVHKRRQREVSLEDATLALSQECGSLEGEPTKFAHPDRHYYSMLRKSVEDQIQWFKKRIPASGIAGRECPISGKWTNIIEPGTVHVDHYEPSFQQLAQDWLSQEGLVITAVDMGDSKQRRSWEEYHEKHANLRLLSAEGHMKLSGQQRSKAARAARTRTSATKCCVHTSHSSAGFSRLVRWV